MLWWEGKSFPGKEFCILKDNGELSIAPFNERVIATLYGETSNQVLQNLVDKFQELTHKVKELQQEWDTTEDKNKLSARLGRVQEYVAHLNAIGDFKPVLQQLREYEQVINKIMDDNFREKTALVEQAAQISADNNNWKEATQKLRDITDQWKALGFVDKKRNEELWGRLEAIKNKFFEKKREHQEEFEKEMLQNLDLKMELVEKAEALASSENWKETTETFRQLLEDWKNTGRTMPEKNEALWQRFIAAKNHFYDRKKVHSENIQVEQEANYKLKLAIVEKAEALQDNTNWNATSTVFNQLMNEWKSIGHVPAEHSNTLWDRFTAARDVFFSGKRSHAEAYKAVLDDNYTQKMALIEKAESLKNSTTWREATEEMNQLLATWKTIGHVAKEHSEVLWNQFLAARKHFFNRKDEDRSKRMLRFEKQKEERLQQTRNFLQALNDENREEQKMLDDFKADLEHVADGPKAEELKTHLRHLIQQSEQKLRNRSTKIQEVSQQLQELEQNAKKDNPEMPDETGAAS
jgi:hypothetical protein